MVGWVLSRISVKRRTGQREFPFPYLSSPGLAGQAGQARSVGYHMVVNSGGDTGTD